MKPFQNITSAKEPPKTKILSLIRWPWVPDSDRISKCQTELGFLFCFMMLWWNPEASKWLGKHSTTKLGLCSRRTSTRSLNMHSPVLIPEAEQYWPFPLAGVEKSDMAQRIQDWGHSAGPSFSVHAN
jgi:hypothetical protein